VLKPVRKPGKAYNEVFRGEGGQREGKVSAMLRRRKGRFTGGEEEFAAEGPFSIPRGGEGRISKKETICRKVGRCPRVRKRKKKTERGKEVGPIYTGWETRWAVTEGRGSQERYSLGIHSEP